MNDRPQPQYDTPMRDSRREAMLRELLDAMHQLHDQRRRRKRIGATLALSALLAAALVIALPRSAVQESPTVARDVQETPGITQSDRSRITVERITTDPDIMQHYAVKNSPPRWVQYIDDAVLLATLRDLDRPTGLVRTAKKVWLTAAVTDEELRRDKRERRENIPPL